jgi:hypothetical protein
MFPSRLLWEETKEEEGGVSVLTQLWRRLEGIQPSLAKVLEAAEPDTEFWLCS